MKSISFMIEAVNQDFFELLNKKDLLQKFVRFLQNESIGVKDLTEKDTSMIPTGWMETKLSNMRATAIETDAKISTETEMTC